MTATPDERQRAVDALVTSLRELGILDERVLTALRAVPRDRFVLPGYVDQAWENHALPIDFGQTISQPYVVAVMTEALQLSGSERVLEIGTGSGYQAAILSLLAREVVSIERIGPLAERARELARSLGYENVEIHVSDGSEGWSDGAPWDAIIVTAGGPSMPSMVISQLNEDGGRLVMPVGREHAQRLVLLERRGKAITESDLGPVAFVPLIGAGGWPGDE